MRDELREPSAKPVMRPEPPIPPRPEITRRAVGSGIGGALDSPHQPFDRPNRALFFALAAGLTIATFGFGLALVAGARADEAAPGKGWTYTVRLYQPHRRVTASLSRARSKAAAGRHDAAPMGRAVSSAR